MNPPPPPHPILAVLSGPLADQKSVTMMSNEIMPPAPSTPHMAVWQGQTYTIYQISREFFARRAALIRAVTKDEEEFFRKCNSSLGSMCLYGHIDGSWEVYERALLAPPRLPEPMRGINLFRENMDRIQWLQEVAKRCDSWLISVSFFVGADILNANGRWLLFNHISSLQTVHEAFLESDTYHRLRREEEERSKVVLGDEEADDKDD